VRVLLILEGETALQVGLEQGLLGVLLDQVVELLVDGLLVLLALLADLVFLLRLGEDFAALLLVALAILLLTVEISIVQRFRQLDRRNVKLGLCGDDEGLVNAAKGATVQTVRAGDKKKASGQLLQENNALSLVAASQEDEDCTRGDVLAKSRGTDLLGASLLYDPALKLRLSCVRTRSTAKRDNALSTVLSTSYFDLLGVDLGSLGGLLQNQLLDVDFSLAELLLP